MDWTKWLHLVIYTCTYSIINRLSPVSFPWKMLRRLICLLPPTSTLIDKTHHAGYIEANYPPPLFYPLGISNFHSTIIFLRTPTLWNWLPTWCFTVHYRFNLFTSRVNRFLSKICSWPATLKSHIWHDNLL